MSSTRDAAQAEVFISYSSEDRERVFVIADALEAAGVGLWLDRERIAGGANYGVEIVRAIQDCKVMILMCSNASMRSRNVKQEIQLAWQYERAYLPLLLEPIGFSEQVEYWLAGCQWIEVMDWPPERWLPGTLDALARAGVACASPEGPVAEGPAVVRPAPGLSGLLEVARYTDQIWPLDASRVQRGAAGSATRGLGAPQDDVQRGFPLGSRVCLAVESDREGHLLLLDEGPEGVTYCLCPSAFAPDTRLRPGRTYLPQEGSRYDAFVVTGRPGREHLLAVVTDHPLELGWMPASPRVPARELAPGDIDALLARLRQLEGDRWTALSTYFDVTE